MDVELKIEECACPAWSVACVTAHVSSFPANGYGEHSDIARLEKIPKVLTELRRCAKLRNTKPWEVKQAAKPEKETSTPNGKQGPPSSRLVSVFLVRGGADLVF